MAELQRRGTLVLVIDVEDDPGILNDGNLRKIDAGKSVEALGALFLRPGAGDDFPAENDIDSVGPVMGSETETVQEIGPGVGDGKVDGLLGTGDDDGFPVVLNEIGKGGSRVGHGIRAVADYEAVIVFVLSLDKSRKSQPLGGVNVGAVEIERLNGVDLAELPGCGNIA